MAGKNIKAPDHQQTTAQQLGSLIKSARDIMRKDKGLSTDLDRLPLLTWIMFLKFLDDMEQIEESKDKMRGERHRPAIEPPYRWRDWAAREEGITGPELLAFINQDEATLPNGKRGPGLLAMLRSLTGGDGAARRRRVIATVFKDINCRMLSGYLLRDVINKVNGIHFLAKEEVFTLGHFYETMLREMRDAAGQNGEFYTPRPSSSSWSRRWIPAWVRPCLIRPAALAVFSSKPTSTLNNSARPSPTATPFRTRASSAERPSRSPFSCAR
jgi:type I restriction enzyme M protein